MPHQPGHRIDAAQQGSAREVLNAARSRYERLTTAVVRWGRAEEAVQSAQEAGWTPSDAALAELQRAEEALLEIYRELPRVGGH